MENIEEKVHVLELKDSGLQRFDYDLEKVYLNPPPFIHGLLHPSNYKTVCFTPWTFQNRLFYPLGGFQRRVCYSNSGLLQYRWFWISFFYLFSVIFWKIIVNHKMKNIILLDSTWVVLHSEYIIRYALVQIFFCNFRLIGKSNFFCSNRRWKTTRRIK